MTFPENIKYAKSHEWVRMDGNVASIGISDFAQSELGDIVFVDITAGIGDELNAGDVFGTIEAVKTVSDLYLPISGKIVEINEKLVDNPELINSDPYGDGWMLKVEVTGDNPALLDSASYSSNVGH